MEKLPESIESSRFISYRAGMLGEFDSRKDLQSTKFKWMPQIFVKLSFRECPIQNYLVYMLLIIWLWLIKFKLVKNGTVGCEFIRHQSMK